VTSVARSCNSFTTTTPVLMADRHSKPISQVRIGDKVLATDPATSRTAARSVVATIVHSGPHRMVEIREDAGFVIVATDRHPFLRRVNQAVTNADDLRAGERLREPDEHLLTVVQTRTYTADLAAYNLTLDDIHTY
jgi:Pretoxin HINT domain